MNDLVSKIQRKIQAEVNGTQINERPLDDLEDDVTTIILKSNKEHMKGWKKKVRAGEVQPRVWSQVKG